MAKHWSKHPILVSGLGALLVGFIGYVSSRSLAVATIEAAALQAEATKDAGSRQANATITAANKPPLHTLENSIDSEEHELTINFNGPHNMMITSTFQETDDYFIRFEGCYSYVDDGVCAFTIRPKRTMAITNIGNGSHAIRKDGSEIVTVSLFNNDDKDGIRTYKKTDTIGKTVMRQTLAAPESRVFLLKIPDYNETAPLDSVLFSRGQGDPGILFPAKIQTFPGVSINRRTVKEYRDALEHDNRDGVIGNPNGKITIVEFLDYRCIHCQQIEPALKKLLAQNTDIRLVVKELPLTDPQNQPPLSTLAARAAIAASFQGKYAVARAALLAKRDLDQNSIQEVLHLRGINISAINSAAPSAPVSDHLNANFQLANALGIDAVPSFVIGTGIIEGASMAAIRKAVAAIRSKR